MGVNLEKYKEIKHRCEEFSATLVAVSKIKPVSDIKALYNAGQLDFGENYVQELVDKQSQLPSDIRWHFIGHLQSNKVKYIVPFVHLIHGVDSLKLLAEISKQSTKLGKRVSCLLQVHIANEETKFGFAASDLQETVSSIKSDPGKFGGVEVCGLMGMASFSDDQNQVRAEFQQLVALGKEHILSLIPAGQQPIWSFGMSGDYELALQEGSNLIRVGSLLFGARL